ncbi:MAG: hypothetical protein Q9164_000949 [Protoblastenia rupestris]
MRCEVAIVGETHGYSRRTCRISPSRGHLKSFSAATKRLIPVSSKYLGLESQAVSRQTCKRPRPVDVNGPEEDELRPRKKRRLRLDLITSRLSKPYAFPPTFIPTRPTLRAGVWTRQRLMRRDLLRRAAIFNSIAMRRTSSGLGGVDYQRLTREASFITDHPLTPQVSSRSLSPSKRKPPDPPDTDEFNAFDADSITDDEEDGELDCLVYSDFNLLRSEGEETEVDDYDEDYSFDSFDGGQNLTAEEGAKAIRLIMEIERKSEVSFAPGIS